MPESKPVSRDLTVIVSLVAFALSTGAAMYGVPVEDAATQEIATQVVSGVAGLALAVAGVRAQVMNRRNKRTGLPSGNSSLLE